MIVFDEKFRKKTKQLLRVLKDISTLFLIYVYFVLAYLTNVKEELSLAKVLVYHWITLYKNLILY